MSEEPDIFQARLWAWPTAACAPHTVCVTGSLGDADTDKAWFVESLRHRRPAISLPWQKVTRGLNRVAFSERNVVDDAWRSRTTSAIDLFLFVTLDPPLIEPLSEHTA